MVERRGGGAYFSAEQYKIDQAKAKSQVNLNPGKYVTPTAFEQPKKGANVKANGEIWIEGFCRFRPASYSKSHYSELSETQYLRAIYPADTVRYTDNFSGNGNIKWDDYRRSYNKSDTSCANLQKKIADNLNDGIPVTMFRKVLSCSDFFGETNPGGKYEFSRAVKIWVKRVAGPDKMDLEFRTQYDHTNGDDNTTLKINDKGSFELFDNCSNCKHTKNNLKSGKAKIWNEGGWNELSISKDEFNTVKIHINDELIYQYQQPHIPITTRFASFWIELPYEWEKKKLMYHIGQVTVECYPKAK